MFTELDIENLRVFRQVRFLPEGGLNVVTGNNGAGKTTLLEAAFLVALGRSFRNRETTPLITEGEEKVRIVSRFFDCNGTRHIVGMEKTRHSMIVRMDGRKSVKRSEIMHFLPIHFIGSDPQELITGGPELRRSFLDGGLFHVEPGYLKVLQEYARVLGQRNAALRKGFSDAWTWDSQLITLGEILDKHRRWYVDRIAHLAISTLRDWGLTFDLEIEYRPGWNQRFNLEEATFRARESDMARSHTTVGPHRADLMISARNQKGRKVLSRGQQKMLIAALYLGQAVVSKEKGEPFTVLLFDDYSAELDRSNRDRLLQSVHRQYRQVITTVLDTEGMASVVPSTVFHVEHGTLEPG